MSNAVEWAKADAVGDDEVNDADIQRSLIPWVTYQDGVPSDASEQNLAVISLNEIATMYGVPEVLFDKYLHKELKEMDACKSMPFTFVLVIAFVGMMVSHLGVPAVASVENSMVKYIASDARFGFMDGGQEAFKTHADVSDMDDWYSWMNRGLVPLLFVQELRLGYGRNSSLFDGLTTDFDTWYRGPWIEAMTNTSAPTQEPTFAPTDNYTGTNSTYQPTGAPTVAPTAPTESPTASPTLAPTEPTAAPTARPTVDPLVPTAEPTMGPTAVPTETPTPAPTVRWNISRIEKLYDVGDHRQQIPEIDRGRILGYNRIVGGIRVRQERSQAEAESGSSGICASAAQLGAGFHRKPCVDGHDYKSDPVYSRAIRTIEPKRGEWLFVQDDVYKIHAKLAYMETGGWLDEYTQKVEVQIPYYNAEHSIHALVCVNFYYSRGGMIWKKIVSGSVWANVFDGSRDAIKFFFYILWLGCIGSIGWTEFNEVRVYYKQDGIKGVWMNYISFWNTVDWVSVLGGLVIVLTCFVQSLHAAALNSDLAAIAAFKLPPPEPSVNCTNTTSWMTMKQPEGGYVNLSMELDGNTSANQSLWGNCSLFGNQTLPPEWMWVNETIQRDPTWTITDSPGYLATIDEYAEKIELAVWVDYHLRIFFALYPAVLGMRLMKAFAAQPRLSLLARTVYDARTDLLHFLFFYISIFTPFAVSGILLFGREYSEYATTTRGMLSTFLVGMGKLNFPSLEKNGNSEAALWLAAFTLIITMMLMSILFSTIISSYISVKAKLRHCETLLDEATQGYQRWLGYNRGELVQLQDVLNDLWKNRQQLPLCQRPIDKDSEVLEALVLPYRNEKDDLRMVTVNFLRTYVMKMKTEQAVQILKDAAQLYYDEIRVDFGQAHSIQNIAMMLYDMSDVTAGMKRQLIASTKTTGEINEWKKEGEVDSDEEGMNHTAIQHKIRQNELRYKDQLMKCNTDLGKAKLWMTVDLSDPLLDAELLREDSDEESDREIRKLSIADRAVARAKRANALTNKALDLGRQLELGEQATKDAMKAIGELETRFLRSEEETMDLEKNTVMLREQVRKLQGEKKKAGQYNELGQKEANNAKVALGESFGDARQLSEENLAFRESLYGLQDKRQRLKLRHAKECKLMRRNIVGMQHDLDMEHRYAVKGHDVRQSVYDDLLHHVQDLYECDDVRCLGGENARRAGKMMKLLEASSKMLISKEDEIMGTSVPVLYVDLLENPWDDMDEDLDDISEIEPPSAGNSRNMTFTNGVPDVVEGMPTPVGSKAKVRNHEGVCELGTKCNQRDEEHLAIYSHPFDPDYADYCEELGLVPEEPSLRGLFDWVDTDDSKKITKFELEAALPVLSILLGEEIVISDKAYAKLDEDGNGVVNFSEFAEWAGPRLGLPLGVKKLFTGRAVDECHGCAVLNCPCEGFTPKPPKGQTKAPPLVEGAKYERLDLCVCNHKFCAHDMTLPDGDGEVPYPLYWDARDSSQGEFFELVSMAQESIPMFQALLDQTYENVWTRDRQKHHPENPYVPSGFKVTSVARAENSKVWREYGVRRAELIQDRQGKPQDGSDGFVLYEDVMSAVAWCENGGALADRLKPEANEWYLFHGTDPKAAESICKSDFTFSAAGRASGTLYGRGIYFAESITKADEYAKANAEGEFCVLVCRVVGGKVKYTDEDTPDTEELLAQCLEGPCDSICGDRKKTRGTFREFVFYDTENFYAEYLVRYKRVYG